MFKLRKSKVSSISEKEIEQEKKIYSELQLKGEQLKLEQEIFKKQGNILGVERIQNERQDLSYKILSVYHRINPSIPLPEGVSVF